MKERKPVYIAIPEDIALQGIFYKSADYDWVSDSDTLDTVIEQIVAKIDCAEKPIIVADTLIKRFDARPEFIDFVNKSGIPVTNFLMGTNIVNMDSENYLGTYLGRFDNLQAKEYLESTDCLISVGTIYGDINSYGTPLPYKINSHIAIYGTYVYIEGQLYLNVKMKDVLNGLAKKINRKHYKLERAELGYPESCSSKEKLKSNYIYPRLQEFFKGEDIIVTETGIITQGIAPIKFPENCEIHSQLLWASTGWATSAAFGAAVANPKARVILLTGEGAHQVSAMEIGNMGRYGIKPVIIVINNNGYTIERLLSEMPESSFNDVMQMDYAKFARSFKNDIWATKVETADDFDKALRVTQIMDKLCYIEAVVDKTDLPEIAEELFTGIERPKPKKTTSDKTGKKKKPEDKLTTSYNKDYETSVHVSLKDFEGGVNIVAEVDSEE